MQLLVTTSFERETTNSHNAPTMPSHSNIDWADAVVKWTRDAYIDVLMFPGDDCDESLTQVFKGDFIQVSPRHRTEHWCLCRSGHMMGWVNLNDVKFIIHHKTPPEPPALAEERNSKKALVSRLIGFFKRN